ncbi:hypothetical protein C0991_007825, partial [Blastosporella zonata]
MDENTQQQHYQAISVVQDASLSPEPQPVPSFGQVPYVMATPVAYYPTPPAPPTPNSTIGSPLVAVLKRALSKESLHGLATKKAQRAQADKENQHDTEVFSDSDKMEITSWQVNMTASKNTTAKASRTPRRSKGNKEADIKVINDDDGAGARCLWTTMEKTALFEYLMGPDADKRFKRLKVNAQKVFQTAATEVFKGKFKWQAIKSQYEQSLKIFGHILAYRNVTGSGGDADEQNKSD